MLVYLLVCLFFSLTRMLAYVVVHFCPWHNFTYQIFSRTLMLARGPTLRKIGGRTRILLFGHYWPFTQLLRKLFHIILNARIPTLHSISTACYADCQCQGTEKGHGVVIKEESLTILHTNLSNQTYLCVIIKPLLSSQHIKEFFKIAFKAHLLDNL